MQGIEFIPNQPIIFEESTDECNRSLAQCYCQKYQPGDYLKLQLKQVPCGNDLICDGSFEADDFAALDIGDLIDTACWLGEGSAGYYGWLFSATGVACHIPGIAAESLSAVTDPYSVGEYYKLTFEISGMTQGALTAEAGGISFEFTENGIHTIYFTATTAGLSFEADVDFDGCLSGISSYLLSNSIDITINQHDGTPVWTLADFVEYKDDYVTLIALIEDIVDGNDDPLEYGKYQIQVVDPCNENEFTSNCIEYAAEHECTKLVDAVCGCAAFGFDFSANFSLVQRLPVIKFNSTYPINQTKFINSNGDNRRVYAERSKKISMRTDYVDEPAHDCFSTQLICDVCTIDGADYFYSESEYKPKWDSDGAYNLATVQVELEKVEKAVIFNANCGDCDEDVINRHRCVLHGWAVDASYKEIHDFEEWVTPSSEIEFIIHRAIINGVDVLGYSPVLSLTQTTLAVFVPDLVIDEVHNNNEYVGYETTPNTIVQNVTDWVNAMLNDSRLKFRDNMSVVDKPVDIEFELLISKHFTGVLGDDQDRYMYTQDGMYYESGYTNIDDPFENAIIEWAQCEEL